MADSERFDSGRVRSVRETRDRVRGSDAGWHQLRPGIRPVDTCTVNDTHVSFKTHWSRPALYEKHAIVSVDQIPVDIVCVQLFALSYSGRPATGVPRS